MSAETLTAAAVLAWAGGTSVSRGRSYVRELDRLVAQPGPGGLSLSGTAYGQDAYQVRGTVQAGQVTGAHCSCPVGSGGTCKHAAALLTRSAELPGDFQQVPPLSELLGPLTTGQLHRLIEQMLSASPELLALVYRSGPVSAQAASIPALFRMVKGHYHDGWQYEEEGLDTTDLEAVLDGADAVSAFDPQQALSMYVEMVRNIEAAYETWADEDDEPFDDLMVAAVGGLLMLIGEGQLGDDDRSRAFAVLTGLENPLHLARSSALASAAEALSEAEQATLQRLFQAQYDDPDTYYRPVFARALTQVIPRRQQTPDQREALLLISRDTQELIGFYLTSDDQDAPAKLVGYLTSSNAPLEPFFTLFEEHAAEEVLEQCIVQRLKRQGGPGRLGPEAHWLFDRYVTSGRHEQAHALATTGLLNTAEVGWERLLRQVSLDWRKDWNAVFTTLQQKTPLHEQLLQLLLTDQHALADAEAFDRQRQGAFSVHLRAELATRLAQDATTRSRAAEVYAELAERLINLRGRNNYIEAARYLVSMQQLIGTEGTRAHVQTLAQKYKNLPSLRDELRKAHLL
ncbi:SWIM zinc finger family protein [Deinococcus ruber]|uniref:SWIM-type domain-containing protein n=1 Tax=Deinococcus ruber TaxID=1848197 RepID=A0A918FDZ3_9DEIO|nr:SWIM zinc finger family protein [Deinococcus ruber]GGR26796.1 hypothetical protein GCM10008957_42830 [Deinococcus ruber]